jgi:hypothetical protein
VVAACGRPATTHNALAGAAIAYDPATGPVVSFGGAPYVVLPGAGVSPSMPDAATFAWNGSRWQRLSPSRSPEARSNVAMAYDPRSRRLILYGGEVAPPPKVKTYGDATAVTGVPAAWRTDRWSWDGRTWTRVGGSGPIIVNELGETWRWNGSTWLQLQPRRSPPGIPPDTALTTMVADPAHGQVLLICSGPIANDQTWIWNGAAWTEAASTP